MKLTFPLVSPTRWASNSSRPTGCGTSPVWRGGTLPYAFAQAGHVLHGPVALLLTRPSGATWSLGTDDHPLTIVRGPGLEFCLVAARRLDPADTALTTSGPDGSQVLALARTYA